MNVQFNDPLYDSLLMLQNDIKNFFHSNTPFTYEINGTSKHVTSMLEFFVVFNLNTLEHLNNTVYEKIKENINTDLSEHLRILFLNIVCIIHLLILFVNPSVENNELITNMFQGHLIKNKYVEYTDWITQQSDITKEIRENISTIMNNDILTDKLWITWDNLLTIKKKNQWKSDLIDIILIQDMIMLQKTIDSPPLHRFINDLLPQIEQFVNDEGEDEVINNLDNDSSNLYFNVKSDITRVQYSIIWSKIQNYYKELKKSIEHNQKIYHERLLHYQEILHLLQANYTHIKEINHLNSEIATLGFHLASARQELEDSKNEIKKLKVIQTSLKHAFSFLQKRIRMTQLLIPQTDINILDDSLPDLRETVDQYKQKIKDVLKHNDNNPDNEKKFDHIEKEIRRTQEHNIAELKIPFNDIHTTNTDQKLEETNQLDEEMKELDPEFLESHSLQHKSNDDFDYEANSHNAGEKMEQENSEETESDETESEDKSVLSSNNSQKDEYEMEQPGSETKSAEPSNRDSEFLEDFDNQAEANKREIEHVSKKNKPNSSKKKQNIKFDSISSAEPPFDSKKEEHQAMNLLVSVMSKHQTKQS